MLKTRTMSAQTDASDNTLMGGSSWAAIATSNRSVRQTFSSLRKFIDQMNSKFLYLTQNIWTQYTNDLENYVL